MAKEIEVDDLHEMFYEHIKEKYPNLSKQHIKTICRSEFIMVKRVMSEGNFEPIRLQYLFKLEVPPSKIMGMLRRMAIKGFYTEKTIDTFTPRILKFIKTNHQNYLKYESRIKKYTGLTIKQIRQGTGL